MAFIIDTDAGQLRWGSTGIDDRSDPGVVEVVMDAPVSPRPVTPTGPYVTPADEPEAWTYLQALAVLEAEGLNPVVARAPDLPVVAVPDGAVA